MLFGKRGQASESAAPPRQPSRDILSYIGRPDWFPAYNLLALETKAFRDSPFGSSVMEAGYARKKMIDEYRAILEICDAFNDVPSDSAYRVNKRSQTEIEEVLRSNILDDCPSYVRLLDLMIQRDILKKPEEAKSS
jgi:hypothetical protein